MKIKNSFKRESFIVIVCANCGCKFTKGDNEYDCFKTIAEAKEAMDDTESWWTRKGNQALCDKCS